MDEKHHEAQIRAAASSRGGAFRRGPGRAADRGRGRLVGTLSAMLFDLDGVVLDSAVLHAAAWKATFDAVLPGLPGAGDRRPFDPEHDYVRHVDGKPRLDGVRDFLAARGFAVPEGDPADLPGRATVHGIGNAKNARFHEAVAARPPRPYPGALRLIRALRRRNIRTAVVSSSKNCAALLRAAGIEALFDARVDGHDLDRLAGKPAPDMFLEAARRLGMAPGEAGVIEDAAAGVEAGARGGFGLVVGVGRDVDGLTAHGADRVVADVGELMADLDAERDEAPVAAVLDAMRPRLDGRRIAVFLDYDGTLTPIVDRPEMAVLADDMRERLARLAARCPVAVISGRDRADVAAKVGLDNLVYAGSHGFDIVLPDGTEYQHPRSAPYARVAAAAARELATALKDIDGALVEAKRFAVAVHYRLVAERDVPAVERAVDAVAKAHPALRKTGGKKIFELRPAMDWDKGRAVRWLIDALDLAGPDLLPIYIGDDETDEDAFAAVAEDGLGIRVGEPEAVTRASEVLPDVATVAAFLDALADDLETRR